MEWKNIRIYGKLLIVGAITVLFSILIGAIAISNFKTINNNTKKQAEYYIPVVDNTFKTEKNWRRLIVFLKDFSSDPSDFSKDKISQQIKIVIKSTEGILANAEKAELSVKNIENLN